MATNYTDITLALAGICQAAKLVQQFALQGRADEQAFNTSLNSLLEMSPESTIAVYGDDINNLKLGLETLIEQLNANNPELTSYWLGLIALAGRLKKNPQAKAELARRVQYMPTQLEYYGLTDDIMLEKIADIYSDVVSPMGKRIQILGSIEYLQQPAIQNRVRACLLAGMRSAILWQQVGGTKWQLLFSRGKILATAKQIYDTL